MANQEHLDILRQDVEVWNKWREKHPDVIPDLSDIDLNDISLCDINLRRADLAGTDFSGANLDKTDFSFADLAHAKLNRASLSHADLGGANFSYASLSGADLSHTDLNGTHFNLTYFDEVNLTRSRASYTLFGSIDLQTVKGLETVYHLAPSTIGIDTLYRSGGNIPEAFLRGAGVPETFITYARSLVNNPIEYYTCFISYSSKDQTFAERLYADLQSKNVRCWFAPEDLKIGDKFRVRIDESIRIYDKLLLILSEHSVRSPWVETEVETAFEKEHKLGKLTLFPIKLDNTVMETNQAWAADIRRTRNIGDFTHWKEHDEYQKALTRLLRDLKQEAKHDTIESDADQDEMQSTSREIES